MEILFICLANSRKINGRCLAGIQVEFDNETQKYKVVQAVGGQKWVRPVLEIDHGQLPNELVSSIKLLNVVSISVYKMAPNGFQSENFHFINNSIKVIGNIGLNTHNLDRFVNDKYDYLFANNNKSLDSNEILSINYSLTFIKVYNPKFYLTNNMNGNPQTRVYFSYKENAYDLPVTDLAFNGKFQIKSSVVENTSCFYFSISLGVKFNDLYYKLVAGVLGVPQKL